MFFIFVANGRGESSLLSSLGPAASVATLLCVIVVTIALVLLTLMCVCSKKATSEKLQNNSAPVAENENISLMQLPKAEDIESQLPEVNKEETNDGELTKPASENGTRATSVTQQTVVHVKEESRPTSHPSPYLPPRNPHNFHGSAHPNNQPSASVQASSRSSTPASLEKIHDACAASHMTGASSTTTEDTLSTKNSQLPEHSLRTCRVQPDYEEVDLHEKPEPSSNAKMDECDDSNIYQDIDLNQESKSQQATQKNSDSIEPYAEFKESPKKSSVVERPQSKAMSLATTESEAPVVGNQSANEIPRYAKIDKSKKSLGVSNSSLANHLPEDGLPSQEVTNSTGEQRSSERSTNVAELYTQVQRSSEHSTNVAELHTQVQMSSERSTNVVELYTQVHKPNSNAVSSENGKDSHVSASQNSTAADVEMVLNPCYAATMLQNYQSGATSGHNSTEPSEEPGYSTVSDEHVNVTQSLDPGYSSIYETQHVYSEITSANSQGQGGAEAAANATGNNSTDRNKSAKEPIYELVDTIPRDEASSQRL